jgi:hypothetical protein
MVPPASAAAPVRRGASLPLCFVRDLVSFRLTNEVLVQRVAESKFTLPEGEFQALVRLHL